MLWKYVVSYPHQTAVTTGTHSWDYRVIVICCSLFRTLVTADDQGLQKVSQLLVVSYGTPYHFFCCTVAQAEGGSNAMRLLWLGGHMHNLLLKSEVQRYDDVQGKEAKDAEESQEMAGQVVTQTALTMDAPLVAVGPSCGGKDRRSCQSWPVGLCYC